MKLANQTETTIRFSGKLVESKAGGTALIPTPNSASALFPGQGTTMVEGTIGGFPFRAPLDAEGIRIGEAAVKAAGVKGDEVAVEITRVGDEPEVMVPADLLEAIALSAPAKKLWPEITPMARREWVRWIASAKQPQTREKRIEVGIDKLTKGMRRPCCFPGLNFITKDLVPPEDTWVALPSSKGPKR